MLDGLSEVVKSCYRDRLLKEDLVCETLESFHTIGELHVSVGGIIHILQSIFVNPIHST